MYYYVLYKEENGFGKQIQGAYIGDVINHGHPQLTKPWQIVHADQNNEEWVQASGTTEYQFKQNEWEMAQILN